MTGVLLMAHGTPSSLDEMPEYLRLVRGGRPPSAELVAEMRAQLRGDRRALAADRDLPGAGGGAARAARRRRPGRRRHAQLAAVHQGRARASWRRPASTRVIGIPLAPQFSTLSVQKYIDAATRGAARRHHVRARSTPFTRIRCCSTRSPSACAPRSRRPTRTIVFTAHSLPVRVIEAGDRYADEVAATAARRGRARRHRAATTSPTRAPAARRSRGSARSSAQLIDERAARGVAQVSRRADRLRLRSHGDPVRHRRAGRSSGARVCGATLRRTESLNTSPTFIAMLEDLVRDEAR